MATTAVPTTNSSPISDALKNVFKKNPTLEELWGKINTRIDETQKELGRVDTTQQHMQATVATATTAKSSKTMTWVIVGAVLLLIWR